MKESYLTYALSVIHSRALPDVRDGLKPSQRRILVAMNDLNLGPRAKFRKCAKIAGDTSGNYHPHGEAVVYPTLVRMAQDFSLRYPLIDGQGNFGSIDDDPPAAMRYTEARMAGTAVEMLADLDKETVDEEPNYDEHAHAADRAARPLPEPALQRLRGHRGRHGDLAAAAQPARDLQGAQHGARRPEGLGRRAVRDRQGPRLPDRRDRDGHATGSVRPTRPGAASCACARATTSRTSRPGRRLDRHRDSLPGSQDRDHRQDRRGGEGRAHHGHLRRPRRVGPRRHAPGDRAEEGRGPAGRRQPALPVHADADDVQHHQPRDRRAPAAHAEPARTARRLHPPPQGRHPPSHAVPAAQGRGTQAHRRGSAHRRRPHRRGDRDHPPLEGPRGGQAGPGQGLRALAAPVAGDRRHAPGLLDRPGAREARGGVQRAGGRDRRPARHPRARRARGRRSSRPTSKRSRSATATIGAPRSRTRRSTRASTSRS